MLPKGGSVGRRQHWKRYSGMTYTESISGKEQTLWDITMEKDIGEMTAKAGMTAKATGGIPANAAGIGVVKVIKVKFRSFDYAKDLERLYAYMMKEENQVLFSHSFQVHNLPMFERWISEKFASNAYHDFFMIEDEAGRTAGFTFSYEFFAYDGHCKFTLCLYEEYQGYGLGAAAAIRMIDYLFRKYPLRQIYISIFDYNANSLALNRKGGFEEVGLFPEYRFYGGGYYALHILRISRQTFYKRYEKTAVLLRNSEPR